MMYKKLKKPAYNSSRNRNRRLRSKIISTSIRLPIVNRRGILWIFTVLFIALQVLFAVQTTTSGANLANLEKVEEILIDKNHELTSELVKSTSLKQIGKKAEGLGFFKPENTIYLNTEDFVAKVNKL
jgi:hypothetical protein